MEIKGLNEKYTITDLLHITSILRSPGGCPWDIEQTHESMKKAMIEEAYEAVDAINLNNIDKLKEELGDVLLQVVFHSQIGMEANTFDFNDVTDEICRKMISRHPHVFGDVHVDSSQEVLKNWEDIKIKQKGLDSLYNDLKDIPVNFPALIRAAKVSKKIRKAVIQGNDNIAEEHKNLINSCDLSNNQAVGQLLYLICSKAEENGIDCELTLKDYTDMIINNYAERNYTIKEEL